ncbi:MAG: glutathione S-transferase [Rhizobiaceae bacterium]|nr:glutathione S-transferase [Rhizobiaceae bacterium]
MLLYDGGMAPNPRRVRIFLAEKGIEVETVNVDINALEQKSDKFSKLNPMQRVPVLVLDDGTAISESVAICRYFEEIQPDPPLMGIDARDKAIVEMWQRRMELNLMMPIAQAFRHLHPGAARLEHPQIGEWGEANKPRAIECMGILDTELASRKFVAGDRFSIADITAVVALQFLKPARIEIPEEMTDLLRWFDEICSRSSNKA